MNKKILTLCAIASIAAAVFSCSKKDDDDKTTTTSTTSTTSTTATTSTSSTTSTTKPTPVIPTPGSNQLAVDTVLFDYEVSNCMSIDQGRYALSANLVDKPSTNFSAKFGKSPNFSNEFTITPGLPTINSSSQVQLTATIDAILYTAQTGKVAFFKNSDSSGIQFVKIKFKGTNDSTKTMSGFFQCP
jgi:hypothetical protein